MTPKICTIPGLLCLLCLPGLPGLPCLPGLGWVRIRRLSGSGKKWAGLR
ncbi:MAG TPA: hypothetical protein VF337_07405 [Candidatus Limnocylindrales bacterium]